MVKLSNPRLYAEFQDWPLGGNKRGRCEFRIEHHSKRGYRFVRQTTGKPKTHTYGGLAAICDGDDGRTYLIQRAGVYDFIKVSRSDFMDASGFGRDGIGGSVFPDNPLYAELDALLKQAYAT